MAGALSSVCECVRACRKTKNSVQTVAHPLDLMLSVCVPVSLHQTDTCLSKQMEDFTRFLPRARLDASIC